MSKVQPYHATDSEQTCTTEHLQEEIADWEDRPSGLYPILSKLLVAIRPEEF
jgi:hypothetical protein